MSDLNLEFASEAGAVRVYQEEESDDAALVSCRQQCRAGRLVAA